MIASLSGIRGIPNQDLTLEQVAAYSANFATATGAPEILLARDSRGTGPTLCRAAAAGMMSRGVKVIDYGIISTPALFRQSRLSGIPAVMVTASHNEPEFNGMKFVVGGAGVGEDLFKAVMEGSGTKGQFGAGSVRQGGRPSYVGDLVAIFGEGSCEGLRVALDLGGGAAISHSPQLLRRLGCEVMSVNDSYGVFSRRVDPVADDLALLRKVVREHDCDIGLGFDCDGDRLVVVDSDGRKRTGDYMLTLALAEILRGGTQKKVVVSLDTTQAVDDVAKAAGAQVFRSKVGEANVVGMMREKDAQVGGEGSSGGLIDASFNYCRDSMLAALVIARGLKREGRRLYRSVPVYHQERVTVQLPRAKAVRGIKRMAATHEGADSRDGVKVTLSKRSWVLVRPSGTEDIVRVSAEAETSTGASKIAKTFAVKLRELSK